MPSYEQLAGLVAAQEGIIAQLQARIGEQDARIVELEGRLAASSRNSSEPPSADGLEKRGVERRDAAYLTAEQAQRLLETIRGDRLEGLFRLMLATGL
jgi:integrase